MQLLIIKNYKTVVNYDSSIVKAIGSENVVIADLAAQKIMRNKKLRRRTVILLGMVLFVTLSPHGSVFAAVGGPDNIARLGVRFWGFVKIIAKWTCIISGGLEVLKNLNSGDVKGIWKVALKYVVAYCVIVGLPWAFDEVDKVFVLGGKINALI